MILVLLLGFIHRTSSGGEYYVKGGILKPLSYLEYNFTKISSDIFPNNLEVKFVMWHTIGTLIYSMDKNGNQFILEVSHMGDIPHMTIKIRKRERDLNFKKLCGCKGYCKEENVTLLVNVKGTKLSISCNGNNESHLEIPNKKDVNSDWPVPPFPNSPHNQAILWALNVPEKYGGDSDPYQIGCCLFYVKYNNEVINMNVNNTGIKNKCPRSCTLYPCNSNEICNEKYTDTGQRSCTKIKPSNAATLNNLGLIISIVINVIIVIVVCVIVPYCYKRKRKRNVTENDANSNEENVRLISIPCKQNNPILIGFGIKDDKIKGINESINEHLNEDNLCNTVCKDEPFDRDIMNDIMQCKVVVVVYNVEKPNNEICEFMCQLTMQYGIQLIPLVISTDKFISNDNMRKLLKEHDNLMYFGDVQSIKLGASEIANKIKHNLNIYTPIEVAPLPKTDNKVIYAVNCKTYNIFYKFLSFFEMLTYKVIVDSHIGGKQFDMLHNINEACVLIFFCHGNNNLCMHHKLVYQYCVHKKLVIPVVVNYIRTDTPKWTDTLLQNKHSKFIEISDSNTLNPDELISEKFIGNILKTIDMYSRVSVSQNIV